MWPEAFRRSSRYDSEGGGGGGFYSSTLNNRHTKAAVFLFCINTFAS